MPDCIYCGAYTKYVNGACYACYKKDKTESFELEDWEFEDEGLPDKKWHYHYGMIKGKIAETLIQELFLSLDYNVFQYGIEHTVPGIMQLLKNVSSDVANQIRRMPDFVIQDKKTKNTFFVEVKFRANECFSEKDLPKHYPYENAYIIIVSKKHIKCLSVEELRKGKEITPQCHNYLDTRKEFDLDRTIIIDFCKFAVKFFREV